MLTSIRKFVVPGALIVSVGAATAFAANERATRTNKAVTAEQQATATETDVEVTRQIRERLTKDDGLSIKAKNVLIVTQGTTVRLQGPVATATESKKIESVAKEFAGSLSIINNITVDTTVKR